MNVYNNTHDRQAAQLYKAWHAQNANSRPLTCDLILAVGLLIACAFAGWIIWIVAQAM